MTGLSDLLLALALFGSLMAAIFVALWISESK